jgi:hypothetical protein
MFVFHPSRETREREKKKLHARCFIDQSTTGCFNLTDQKSKRGKNLKNKKKKSDYEINCSLRKYVVSAKGGKADPSRQHLHAGGVSRWSAVE